MGLLLSKWLPLQVQVNLGHSFRTKRKKLLLIVYICQTVNISVRRTRTLGYVASSRGSGPKLVWFLPNTWAWWVLNLPIQPTPYPLQVCLPRVFGFCFLPVKGNQNSWYQFSPSPGLWWRSGMGARASRTTLFTLATQRILVQGLFFWHFWFFFKNIFLFLLFFFFLFFLSFFYVCFFGGRGE